MNITVEDGKLLSKLNKLSKMQLSVSLERACLIVENSAKEKAPVASGELRRSITHKVSGNEGEVGTSLHYAPYVEYGTGLFSSKGNGRKDVPWVYCDAKGNWHSTSGQRPQPFLIPAFEENKSKIYKEIEKQIKEELS